MPGANSSNTLELGRHGWYDGSGNLVVAQRVLKNGAPLPSSQYQITQEISYTVTLSNYTLNFFFRENCRSYT